VLCPVGKDESTRALQLGVFLRHVNCRERNPFWLAGQTMLNIPAETSLTLAGKAYPIQHWQLGALGELSRLDGNAPDMWFPLPLFRAVNAQFLEEPQNSGVTVRLAGAKNAGKTVLATMALVRYGYAQSNGDTLMPEANIVNYVHAAPYSPAQPSQEFLQALLPFSMMRSQQNDPQWVRATPPTTANVKAAFLRTPKEDKSLVDEVRSYFSGGSRWRALVFYDTAGEENERPFEKHADKVAVGTILLDASRLGHFNGISAVDLQTAEERLETISCQRKCLILTKLDLVRGQMTEDETKVLDEIAAGKEPGPGVERDLLVRWLRSDRGRMSERSFASLLRDLDVFFVWTEDLDATEIGKLPRSFGIGNFVHWCLEGSRRASEVREAAKR
jgi:hypothetical protein